MYFNNLLLKMLNYWDLLYNKNFKELIQNNLFLINLEINIQNILLNL
jgi:hypothetical protein